MSDCNKSPLQGRVHACICRGPKAQLRLGVWEIVFAWLWLDIGFNVLMNLPPSSRRDHKLAQLQYSSPTCPLPSRVDLASLNKV